MAIFSRLYGKPTRIEDSQPKVIPVPIPPLVTVLSSLEKTKGAPLSESEVINARDSAICMMMSIERAKAMAEIAWI